MSTHRWHWPWDGPLPYGIPIVIAADALLAAGLAGVAGAVAGGWAAIQWGHYVDGIAASADAAGQHLGALWRMGITRYIRALAAAPSADAIAVAWRWGVAGVGGAIGVAAGLLFAGRPRTIGLIHHRGRAIRAGADGLDAARKNWK